MSTIIFALREDIAAVRCSIGNWRTLVSSGIVSEMRFFTLPLCNAL